MREGTTEEIAAVPIVDERTPQSYRRPRNYDETIIMVPLQCKERMNNNFALQHAHNIKLV